MCFVFVFSLLSTRSIRHSEENREKRGKILKYRKRALSAENPSPSFGCSTSGRSTHENIFRFSLVSFLLFPESTTGDRTGERVEFDERRKIFSKNIHPLLLSASHLSHHLCGVGKMDDDRS